MEDGEGGAAVEDGDAVVADWALLHVALGSEVVAVNLDGVEAALLGKDVDVLQVGLRSGQRLLYTALYLTGLSLTMRIGVV